MTANVAIVDERDPLVHYVGSWTETGAPVEFQKTTKFSNTAGSTASFSFEGTSIVVYGSVAAINPPKASMSFVVDNSVGGSYTPSGNLSADAHHQALWASPTMSNGSHTLVITQTAAQPSGVIYLDYFLYNTSSTAVDAYFIDDRDARIAYTGGWREFGSDTDFQHTSHGSSSKGDLFAVYFEGKSISMYGGINNGSAEQVLNASIAVDGGPPVFFVPSTQPAAVTPNNLIFNSGDLADGSHTLAVTAENDHTVWVDYFVVKPGAASSASSSPSASSNTTPHKTSTDLIILVAVGAAVLGLVAIATFFFLRRRKSRQARQTADVPLSHVAPFSQFIGGVSPFASSHAYSALSGSDAHLDSMSSSSGNTPSAGNLYGAVPNSKRGLRQDASASAPASSSGHSGASGSRDAPPQYFE